MIKLLKYFRAKDWILSVVILGFIVCQVLLDLALPDYMGKIVDLIEQQGTINEILIQGLKMLGIVAGSVLSTIIVSYLAARVAAGFAKRVRRAVFTKINSFSMEEMEKFSTASLITRTTNDITQIQQVITMFLRMALSAPVMAIGAIVKIVGKSGTLSWITAVAIILLLSILIIIFSLVSPKFKKMQKLTDKINGVTRENLTGIKVVRAYNAEKIQEEKFDKVNTELTKTDLFINRVFSIMTPGMQLIMGGLSLAIVWVGAYLIAGGSISLAVMTTFTQYAMKVIISFLMLSVLFIMVPRGFVSGNRIYEVLKTENKIINGTVTTSEEEGTIEFKNVSFKYPDSDDYVLKNISFSVNKGETVAFIGSTGSGKSTLINLVPRFYDATEGEVLVDGINVKEYDLNSLYKKLGYVPQKSFLFSGTVEENIKYGDENATEEQVNHALKTAQASFVEKLEGGLNYPISQGGKNVSGGQRQRLAIARAIVKKPEIFVFDDSFSALDYKTDKALRKALKKETAGATSLIVAQRIGTIMDANKIIVLDKGEMVGIGTHKELMENCKIYQEIAYSQLSKEELA
ncbi:MAG TPA: ABC transporter ATP-binding protein [Candidatus Caccopulliclostridium gallistercoris]|uniref:ABC transporter ATP-binding protein n=1 Tax=Candidatus Caccopulliclostridium gallistercoris TaxID=2840719 RepID=A0A9D1NF33_9FIRM|nr:ABC transporter ATP-binding protein [Candidatus Caccopulliclostridium gallistercoris]